MKFIDLFAGIGGFRRGMEMAGHECVGFCEFDKYAVASYTSMHLLTEEQREYIKSIPVPLKKNGESNFTNRQKEIWKEQYKNGEWFANDIRAVDAGSMPHADCWCFGFPCQDISIAGNCLGFAGHRSSLFFAVTRLVRDIPEESRPKYLFIENVKNLLSVNRGFDFARLLIELDEIGYDAEWEVLNSKNFGIPQNRERVFIIGHLRGRSTRKIFPLGEADRVHNETRSYGEIHKIAQCLTSGGNDKWSGDYIVKNVGNVNPSGKGMNGNVYDSSGVSPTLTTNKGEGLKVIQIGNCMPTATRDNPNQGRIYDPTGISPCLNKSEGGGREPLIPISMTRNSYKEIDIANTLTAGAPAAKCGNNSPVTGVVIPVLAPDRAEKRQNGRMFKENGDPMFTLTGQDRHGVSDGARIRKLTPREYSRLQGWEDIYYERAAMVNSDSQIYKQEGNGVTVPVVYEIAKIMV